jgi:hypothetical protein
MTALSAIGGKPRQKPVPPCHGSSPGPPHLPMRKKGCSRGGYGCCWAALCCSAWEPGARFSFGRFPRGWIQRRRLLPCRKAEPSGSALRLSIRVRGNASRPQGWSWMRVPWFPRRDIPLIKLTVSLPSSPIMHPSSVMNLLGHTWRPPNHTPFQPTLRP